MHDLTKIHELIQAGEGHHLEFKESPGISCPMGDSINLFSLTCPENYRTTNEGKD